MKRRNFLKTGTAVTLPLLLNGMGVAAMPKSSLFDAINDESDKVLVIIQMIGGNDGINMIVPLDQYSNLANARSNILLPENSLLSLSDTLGLHPTMEGVKALHDEGQLGIIQSVGYPNQNRSHFRSTDIWTSGSPANEFWATGWIGRHYDELYPGFPEGYPNETYPDPFAITMGTVVSETCQGAAANYSLTLNDPFNLTQLAEGEPGDLPDTPYGEELAFLRTTISQTNAYSETITAAANNGANMVDYPETRLAEQLKNVALLISGGLQTKVYVVSIGGFDTHANQVDLSDNTTGAHAALLQQLSNAMAAFQQDLKLLNLEERVIGMTFSEFGRRIRSNDSLGTDHGTAAPLMLFGSCVNPQVLGDNPEIPEQPDIQEGIPMQYDFRDIYGSILMDWFEVSEENVRALLHQEFQYLPIIRVCENVTSTNNQVISDAIEVINYPNPFRNWTTIRFTSGNEWARLSVFDTMGSELKVLVNKRLNAGEHEIRFDAHHLPAGSYYYRLQLEGRMKTRRMVKV